MKTILKVTCVTAFATLFFGVLAAGTGRTNAAAFEGASAAAGNGRAIYVSNCARCHGGDGGADTELGRLNETPPINGGRARKMSAAAITGIVRRGKASMPGFSKKLTPAQISSVVAYVRTL